MVVHEIWLLLLLFFKLHDTLFLGPFVFHLKRVMNWAKAMDPHSIGKTQCYIELHINTRVQISFLLPTNWNLLAKTFLWFSLKSCKFSWLPKMLRSNSCFKCKSKSLVLDDVIDQVICNSRCVLQHFNSFEANFSDFNGLQGTFVHR